MKSTLRRATAATVLAGAVVASAASGVHAAPATAVPHQRPIQYVAQIEGVSVQTLRADLKQGETLLQIAAGKYATAADLAAVLLAPVQARMTAAVTAGKLSAAQESVRYAKLDAKVTALVIKPHPAGALLSLLRPQVRILLKTEVKAVAATCSTTPRALFTLLHTGGLSVLAACQRTNPQVTAAQLTAVVFSPIQARLQAAEQTGRITATQEAARSAHIQTRITRALTRVLPAHPAQP
jgi:hypothetical protein